MPEKTPYEDERRGFTPLSDTHSSWLTINSEGVVVERRSKHICYAPLRNCSYPNLYLFFGKTRWEKHGIDKWVDWILNRSFFSDAFLTKTAEEAREFGVSVDTTKDWAYLVGSMMILRHPFEFSGTFTWAEFIDLGLSEEDAFVAACNVFVQDGHLAEVNSNRNHFPVYGKVKYDYYVGKLFKPSGTPFNEGYKKGCGPISRYHWSEWDYDYTVGRNVPIKAYGLAKKEIKTKDPFFGESIDYRPEATLDNLNKIVNYYKEL